MRVTKRVNLLSVLALIGVVKAGLLRVPKIYNTVITSNGNLEPSRAYPIVQSVLSVGVAAVQPVLAVAPEPVPVPAVPHVASTSSSDATILKQTDARHLYPIAVGGLYPLLATTNTLYPTVLYHHQPVLAPVVSVQQQHVSGTVPAVRLRNPGIPDVPPPPLPVSANKNI
ncbi:hypothetical protein CBL_14283 [Carabus blaptoides fortunei]